MVEIEFKKSEVGAIPKEWSCCTINQKFTICNNLRLPISDFERKKIQGKYPYWGPTRIQDYINHYRLEGTYALIGEDGDHFLKYRNQSMTQLVSGKFNVNNHAHIIQGNSDIETKWFYYYFKHRDITKYISRQGAGRYKLNKTTLESMYIAVPPMEEQKDIVKIIADFENLILSLSKIVEKKKSIKQGTMQELLTGKRSVKGCTSQWNSFKLSEVCDVRKGSIITEKNIKKGNVPVIAGGKYPAYFHNVSNRKGNVVTISASGANAGIVSFYSEEIFASDCLTIEESSNIDIKYIYYFLLLNQEKIFTMQTGGAQPHVHSKDIGNIYVKLPQKEDQKLLSSILCEIDLEIEKLEAKLLRYQKIKQGLMQELLTGRTRVITRR